MTKIAEIASSKSKIIGYLRVSTFSQALEKNKADIVLVTYYFDSSKAAFVEEIISGEASRSKRKIAEIFEHSKAGDNFGNSRIEIFVCQKI